MKNIRSLVSYNYAAVAIPYGTDMSFGLSVMRSSIDNIPDTVKPVLMQMVILCRLVSMIIWKFGLFKITEFSDADWAFYLTFAKRQTIIFLGAQCKIISRSIAEFSAIGVGFDLALLINLQINFILVWIYRILQLRLLHGVRIKWIDNSNCKTWSCICYSVFRRYFFLLLILM